MERCSFFFMDEPSGIVKKKKTDGGFVNFFFITTRFRSQRRRLAQHDELPFERVRTSLSIEETKPSHTEDPFWISLVSFGKR